MGADVALDNLNVREENRRRSSKSRTFSFLDIMCTKSIPDHAYKLVDMSHTVSVYWDCLDPTSRQLCTILYYATHIQ